MGVTWSVERLSDRARRVVVCGAVDIAAEQPVVEAVGSVLDTDDEISCQIDLNGVSFIDSSGVRALMRLVRQYGPRVTVGPASQSVTRVLEIAGVLDWLGNGNGNGNGNGADPSERTTEDAG